MGISDIRFSKRKTIADTRYSSPSVMSVGTRVPKRTINKDPVAQSVYLITHEQVHQSSYKAEDKFKRFAGHGIDNPLAERAVMESVRPCVNCGDNARHMHGRHGCCGRMNCHVAIGGSHLVAGERGLNKGLLAPIFDWRIR